MQISHGDGQFEVQKSSTAQKLTLYHPRSPARPAYIDCAKSVVGRAIGVIVVNTRFADRIYDPGSASKIVNKTYVPSFKDEIALTMQLFEDLRIKEVRLHQDKSALELQRVFALLQGEAHAYEGEPNEGKVLAVIIRWIGLDMALRSDHIEKVFGLTPDGRAVNLDDNCLLIADKPSTRVLFIADKDSLRQVPEREVDWDEVQLLPQVASEAKKRLFYYHMAPEEIHFGLQEVRARLFE